jgi:hypothetical protein
MTILIFTVALVVLMTAFSYFAAAKFAKVVAMPDISDYEKARQDRIKKSGFDLYSVLEGRKVEEFLYRSEFGYNIFGRIIYADESKHFKDGRQRVVILSHGWTSNHITMLAYGKIYLELGFSLVAFDHRFHGKSDKNVNCTMGLYESKDLIGLGNYVRNSFPKDTIWGLQGESMGSATVMQAAPDMKWLSFVVEDCGYSSVRGEMAATLDAKKLPHFPILNIGGAILKRRYNLDMSKVNAVESVPNIEVPMLFCHGDNDTFVPTKMVYDVYNAKKDKKHLQLYEGSTHAESIWDHPEQYKQVLEDFLKQYKII